ncbi:hypothetical protein RSOLAG22IIIB_07755 [Rhizoctonia solani]|uniref:Uncharacterized protein n=1 Tax=Rhizoctonia solani TaxID=456999 RepID=A0A0K6FPV4_9AGAM|nr:hypothetical protein RSOLAG22IIIB_07755 [Rhizoctonia solani]
MHSSILPPMKHVASGSLEHSTPSSPSMSLADFDYDSDSPVERPIPEDNVQRWLDRDKPKPVSPIPAKHKVQDPVSCPSVPEFATKEEVSSLRQLIQQEFEQLKAEKPTFPQVEIPKEAFTDALRAEMAVQLAKISVLEEDNRKLRAEKQELRTALERVRNQPGLQADLNAAKQELERVYVERQGLWDERAALWKERGDLWEERGDLWRERGSLWDERAGLWAVRDGLMEKVASLEAKGSK